MIQDPIICLCIYTPDTHFDITDLSGVITSPGYPQNMARGNYEWTFSSPLSHAKIAVYFEDINLDRSDRG